MVMRRAGRGFTLIELLVVMAIVATLLSIATPRYFDHLERSRETALRQTLNVVRDAIDKYHADTDSYPEKLDDLVGKRYLRSLPFDPLTESDATWILVAPPAGARGQVYDLKSGASGVGRDGKAFAEW
jgi:general secretion pathway protein G